MKKLKINQNWMMEDWGKEIYIKYESSQTFFCPKCHTSFFREVCDGVSVSKLLLEDFMKKKDWKETSRDSKIFLEDGLLNSGSIGVIEAYHGGKVSEVRRHVRVVGKEVDAELILKFKKTVRRVGIELKEFDLLKALSQAIERRKFFHYFYIITYINKIFFGDYVYQASLKSEFFQELFENKIGWIGYSKRIGFIMLYPSKLMRPPSTFNKWLKGGDGGKA